MVVANNFSKVYEGVMNDCALLLYMSEILDKH